MDIIYKRITTYLLSIVESDSWSEILLNVEVQPGVLGLNGYYINIESEKKTLKTRPTEQLREDIKVLHDITAIDNITKWNRLTILLKSDYSFTVEYIWDQPWQDEIDSLNLDFKKKNPKYELPKWNWELKNED